MTRGQLEALLKSYGVYFTNTLVERLMKEFDKLNAIRTILNDMEEIEEEEGSQYGRKMAKLNALEQICEVMKGE